MPDSAIGTTVVSPGTGTGFAHLRDLDATVGHELGRSGWHRITQDMVDRFAELTDDHQGIHIDPGASPPGPTGKPSSTDT